LWASAPPQVAFINAGEAAAVEEVGVRAAALSALPARGSPEYRTEELETKSRARPRRRADQVTFKMRRGACCPPPFALNIVSRSWNDQVMRIRNEGLINLSSRCGTQRADRPRLPDLGDFGTRLGAGRRLAERGLGLRFSTCLLRGSAGALRRPCSDFPTPSPTWGSLSPPGRQVWARALSAPLRPALQGPILGRAGRCG
jgi:hypothetical protein